MKKEISILIPTYNCCCKQLVEALQQQCETIKLLQYEIIVADDASPEKSFIQKNNAITQLKNVHYIVLENNIGRAAIRNFLAQQACYNWLLFIDGDMTLHNPSFIATYLQNDNLVIYGGYDILGSDKNNLRYMIEKKHPYNHIAQQRQIKPFHNFHTCNFLVSKQIMLNNPFNESIKQYGYEDVLFGKQLKNNHLSITHIDNTITFESFESNQQYVEKTEQSLQTLFKFQEKISGFSTILDFIEKKPIATSLLKYTYPIIGKFIRNKLIYNKPRIFLFNIYKLIYFLHLKHQQV